jgi:hypothetical protein
MRDQGLYEELDEFFARFCLREQGLRQDLIAAQCSSFDGPSSSASIQPFIVRSPLAFDSILILFDDLRASSEAASSQQQHPNQEARQPDPIEIAG